MKNIYNVLFVLLLLTVPALAQKNSLPTENMSVLDQGKIKQILKSDIILLDNDKRYKLDNIRIPPYRNAEALDELNQMFLNKHVTVYTQNTSDDLDRYGVPLAHVISEDGAWVQGDLVSKGLAWVFGSETNLDTFAPLLRLETDARTQHRGFWQYAEYALKTPENVGNFINSFQLVEGTILDAAVKQETIFLNFGKDWKTDFTVRVPRKLWRAVSDTEAASWKKRRIRVRGWVEEDNGPMINILYPEDIELLPQTKK